MRAPPDVFALIAETSFEGIVIIDSDSSLLFVNSAAATLFGYTPEELIGQSLTVLMPEELRAGHRAGVSTYLESGVRRLTWRGIELPGLHRSGQRIPLEIAFAEARDGERVFFAGFVRDLTESHWSNARLAAQYAVADIMSTAENEHDALTAILPALGKHLDFAAGNLWMLGHDRLQWMSAWHASTMRAEHLESDSRVWVFHRGEGLPGRAWAEGGPVWIATIDDELNFPRKDTAIASNVHSGLAFPLWSGERIVGVIEFFSTYVRPLEPTLVQILDALSKQIAQFLARHTAQQALRDTEAQHRTLFENANDAFAVSAGEHFVYVNQAYARMFGYDHVDELTGISIYETLPPAQQAVVREHRQRRHGGLPEPMRYESRGKRKDGSEFSTEVRATDYWINGLMYTLAIMRDTTLEREAREVLTQSHAALLRANNDLEQFAYAASHDLQEPLRLILLYSQLLRRRHNESLSVDAQQLLDTITESARRINVLVKDLLSYTNVASLDAVVPALLDPNSVLEDVRSTLQETIAQTQAVITADALPRIRIHRTHLFQLFQNLLSNSIKYHSPGQAPVVHVTGSPDDASGTVEVVVRDNGSGIAPEYHERVFGVFKRLHASDIPGTGIGLAICKKIVEHYGGRIWVESTVGMGARFHLTLPG
ncbi:MAG TPA: PAS domain S-box protein [Bryobacteraceae bacterium]|nr:PAS domain S-box protein [Bryobacteraceae bacterium]